MTSTYVLIYTNSNNLNDIKGDYVNKRYALSFLKNYKSAYIFKLKNDLNIFYLNFPLKDYYKTNSINNDIEENEEDIITYSYLEVRVTNILPSIRICVNME